MAHRPRERQAPENLCIALYTRRQVKLYLVVSPSSHRHPDSQRTTSQRGFFAERELDITPGYADELLKQ